jgi:hypothetical protein
MTQKKVSETLVKFHAPASLKDDLLHLAAVRNISLSALLRLIVSEYIKTKG